MYGGTNQTLHPDGGRDWQYPSPTIHVLSAVRADRVSGPDPPSVTTPMLIPRYPRSVAATLLSLDPGVGQSL